MGIYAYSNRDIIIYGVYGVVWKHLGFRRSEYLDEKHIVSFFFGVYSSIPKVWPSER